MQSSRELESVRLDVWLNVACLFKTRNQARAACARGRIRVNGQAAKAHRLIRVTDRIEFQQQDWSRIFVVRQLCDHSIARQQAKLLYEDLSPPRPRSDPLERILSAPPSRREKGSGRPTKRERRSWERLVEGED